MISSELISADVCLLSSASSFSISTARSHTLAFPSVSTVHLFPWSSLIVFVISEISDFRLFILLALDSIEEVTF